MPSHSISHGRLGALVLVVAALASWGTALTAWADGSLILLLSRKPTTFSKTKWEGLTVTQWQAITPATWN